MRVRTLVLTLALVLPATGAGANGRFPSSVSVQFRPGNGNDIYLGTTFGLLVSHDDGAGFYWLCEQNIGYAGTFDPTYRVGADGTIYSTTFDGLRVSRDGGCSFETATEAIWVDSIDVGPDSAVWATTAEAGQLNDVLRSTDAGRTFTPLGLSSSQIWWKSVAVAPGRASRAYVTGYQVTQVGPDGGTIPPQVHLYRTDDNGGNWTQLPVTGFMLGTSPLVLVTAVAPGDGSTVFARSVRATGPGDILYRSTDAGLTWTEVLVTIDSIRDVLVRSNGDVLVATVEGGMARSTDQGATFQPIAGAPKSACLGERGGTLFACGANWEPDFFTVGRSTDATSWSKVLRFVEMKGPLSCPAGTVQRDVCEALQWPALREQFGIPDEGGVDASGPPRDPGGCCGAGSSSQPIALAGLLSLVLAVRLRSRGPR